MMEDVEGRGGKSEIVIAMLREAQIMLCVRVLERENSIDKGENIYQVSVCE